MSEEITIILNQIGIFVILMGLGFGFIKGKIISEDSLRGISALLMKLLMPITVFYVIYESGATLKLFGENILFMLIVVVLFVILLACGTLLSKFMKMRNAQAVPFILYFVFNNNNFFGLPLITSLFGSAASRVNFSQHLIIDNLFLWTIGVYLCSRHLNEGNFFKQIKNSINGMTLAIVLALVFLGFGIEVPAIINQALAGFKASSGTIAMFYVGCLLATTDYQGILKDKSLYFLIIIKMIVVPLLILVFCRGLLGYESSLILAIMMGLPGKILVSIMVGNYGLDDRYAAKLVFATTIVALFTIPLITWVSTLL